MSTALTLLAKLGLNTDEFKSGIAGAQKEAGGFASSVGGALKSIAGISLGAVAVGVGAVAAGLAVCAKAAAEEEVGIAKMGAAVKATGADWGTASGAIEAYLSSELKRTALDDGAGRESISRLTTATGDYRAALELMPLAQDLARAKGMDLASAAEIVGKVHGGNTGILARYGIVLQEGATAQEALAAMQSTFAGQAEAYGNTFQGSQEKMSIAMGNLKETIGAAVLPVLASLTTKFADVAMNALPMVENAVNNLAPVVSNVFSFISTTIQNVLEFILPVIQDFLETVTEWWGENYATIQATVETTLATIQAVIEAVLSAVQAFWQTHGDTILSITTTAWGLIQTTVNTVITVIRGIIQTVTALIHGDWSTAWETIRATAEAAWGLIQTLVQTAIDLVQGIIETTMAALARAWSTAWDTIAEWIGKWWDALKKKTVEKFAEVQTAIDTAIAAAIEAVKTTVKDWGDAGKSIIEGLASGVSGAVQSLIDAITGTVNSAISWAKKLLGIGSPSREFREIGREIPRGMAIGIGDEADLVARELASLVERAMRDAEQAIVDYVPGAGGGAVINPAAAILPAAATGGGGGGGGGGGKLLPYSGGEIPAGYELGDDGLLWPKPSNYEFNTQGYQEFWHEGKWRRRYFSSYGRIQAAIAAAEAAAEHGTGYRAPERAEYTEPEPRIVRPGTEAGVEHATGYRPPERTEYEEPLPRIVRPDGGYPEEQQEWPSGTQPPLPVRSTPGPTYQFYLTANYGYQSETSLAQDVRMLQMLYGGA